MKIDFLSYLTTPSKNGTNSNDNSNFTSNKMPRVQVEEEDDAFAYMDHPDDAIIPEDVPHNPSVKSMPSVPEKQQQPSIFSYFTQQNQQNSVPVVAPIDAKGSMVDSDHNTSSAQNHYNRLQVSSSTAGFPRIRPTSTSSGSQQRFDIPVTSSDELNETSHFVRGKGVLASKKDVNVPPDVFAEGCKLLQAAALGNTPFLESLLRANPQNINFRDYDRRTALHVAASEGKLGIVKLLVEKYNAPINRSDRWGGSPLDDAHRHRHPAVVAYLREKGASTGTTDQTTNLITAAVTGDLDEVKMIIEGGGSTPSGPKPLTSSSGGRRSSNNGGNILKKEKVENGVNINAGDYDKRTSLHLAAAAGHAHIVSFLLANGANVNCVDNWGGTPLDDAIRTGNVECIRIIKENGGDVGKNRNTDSKGLSESARNNEDMNLTIDFSELDVIDKIGAGAFGEIYKCRWRGTLVAAKCIKSTKIVNLWKSSDLNKSSEKNSKLTEEEVEEALKDFRLETKILRSLRHPNICMLLGYSQTDNFEVMISELMKCSLLDVFTSHMLHGTTMTRRTQIIYARHLARGMNYLHQCKPPVIHRDLKPANLLIDFSGTLKISDFGLAKVRPDPKKKENQGFRMTGETGSYRFMAPEVFRHEQYAETVDIYSFAMIFYYLISGRPPWPTLSGLNAVTKASVEADRPIVNRSWDSQISNLMQRCWDENPSARPSFSEILKELNDYAKNVLKIDVDTIVGVDDTSRCSCIIS